MINRTKTLMDVSSGVFLDLSSCGSSIRWGVSVKRWKGKVKNGKPAKPYHTASMEICLTDCSRVISWHGDGRFDRMDMKLAKAIKAMTAMRRAIRRAKRLAPQYSTREY